MKDIKYFKTYEIADLKDMLYKTTERNKQKTAFKLKNSEGKIYNVSYEKFKNDVEALGTKLLEMNMKDKRIAIIGKNSYTWAVSYLAACIVGIVVPMDKELKIENIIEFLNTAKCDMLIGDTKYITNISKGKEKLINKSILFVDMQNTLEYLNFDFLISDGNKIKENGNTEFKNIKIDPDAMKILLFTSGTTGNSKAVCLSHKNICSNIVSIASTVKVDNKTSVLSILPLHHTYECTIGYLLVIYGGGNIAYCEGLRYITKNIIEFRPSFILCVPLLLEKMYKKIVNTLKESLPKKYTKNEDVISNIPFFMKPIVKKKVKKSLGGRMKTFIVGAAALKAEIVEDYFKLGLKVLQGYGLTECSPLVVGNNDTLYKAASCGMPIPNVEYKIENPNDKGIGEIIVKGPNVMLGYYENEEETKKVLKDGWFHTGDLGYKDSDEFLYITGRCKNMILTKNGENIYPEEIEQYLNENELISEALIIGMKDEDTDDVYVKAKIFPNIEAIKEMFNDKIPTKEDISKIISDVVKAVNKKLPNYKHIKKFNVEEEDFERTTTNKVKRYGKNMK